jgi:putative ABC transport system ATP-binding protein
MTPAAGPLIQLSGITRVYRTESIAVEALRGIDLTVDEGELVAIMGSSGSGKSTLMNILGCLDRPTEGHYLLRGQDVATLSRDQLARIRNQTIGFVFQNFNLLPRTSALENVELPLLYTAEALSWKQIHERARAALDIVGLSDRADHSPSELSGGQQQRVAIARALVTRPGLLLADEPTGNLDTRTGLEVMDVIQRLNDDGLTVLMVTHEPDIARFAGRTIVLRDGLVRSDRPAQARRAAELLADWQEDDDVGVADSSAAGLDGEAPGEGPEPEETARASDLEEVAS